MFYSLKLFTNKLFTFALKKDLDRVRKNSALLRDGIFKLFRSPGIDSTSPRNHGGLVRQPYSYSVPSPHLDSAYLYSKLLWSSISEPGLWCSDFRGNFLFIDMCPSMISCNPFGFLLMEKTCEYQYSMIEKYLSKTRATRSTLKLGKSIFFIILEQQKIVNIFTKITRLCYGRQTSMSYIYF